MSAAPHVVPAGGRVPPHDITAEQSLLGAALLDGEAAELVASLSADDFYFKSHRVIAETIAALISDRRPVDILTVGDRLKQDGNVAAADGIAYVASLTDVPPTTRIENVEAHARIVRDKAVLRRIVWAAKDWIDRAHQHDDPGALLREIADLSQSADGAVKDVRTAREVADDLIREIQAMNDKRTGRAFVTGVQVLDDFLWVKDTDLFVIAGRPSTGKTTLAGDILCSVGRSGRSGLYASAEMPDADILARLAKAFGAVDSEVFRRATTPERVFPVLDAVDQVGRLPIYLTTQTHAPELIRLIRKLARARKISCAIVDMLQRIDIPDAWGETQAERLGSLSRRLKQLALEERIPIFALSSMNRSAGDDGHTRPTMASLKGSGDIESDADTILLLHRRNDVLTEWIFGKVREGVGEGSQKQDRAKLLMRRDFSRGQFVEASAPDDQQEGEA